MIGNSWDNKLSEEYNIDKNILLHNLKKNIIKK